MDQIISVNDDVLNMIYMMEKIDLNKMSKDIILEFMTQKNIYNNEFVMKHLYKESVFNYISECETGVIIYNTLYNSLVRLEDDEYQIYKSCIVNKNNISLELIKNGIWVDETINEYRNYMLYCKFFSLYVSRPINLTITTTLKCNARCAYCYEKGVEKADIIEGAEQNIVDIIKKFSDKDEVEIVWFGGEPLMNTDFIDKLCFNLRKENIRYNSFIITNGSLITDEMVEDKFDEWKIKSVQITLDGTYGKYETIKNYKDKTIGGFYNILSNIVKLAKKGICVSIRLNIDKDNMDDIIKLTEELGRIFSSYDNVNFYPAFLTGTSSPLSESEKYECVRLMYECIVDKSKLSTHNKLYSLPRMVACMNEDPKSFTVDVTGHIYTCEHDVGKPCKSIGNIMNEEKIVDMRGLNIHHRDECKKCVFLPKCFGGCNSNYLNGDEPCMIEKYLIKGYIDLL